MGAFNVVSGEAVCPACNRPGRFDVQYKYGDAWQHHYEVGATIKWGGNDQGLPNVKKVLVEGVGGPCLHCQTESIEFDVVIENDRLTEIRPIGRERQENYPEGFRVVKE